MSATRILEVAKVVGTCGSVRDVNEGLCWAWEVEALVANDASHARSCTVHYSAIGASMNSYIFLRSC